MIIDIYDKCSDNEVISENGVNINLRFAVGDDWLEIRFEDDAEKTLFCVQMDLKDFKKMVSFIPE